MEKKLYSYYKKYKIFYVNDILTGFLIVKMDGSSIGLFSTYNSVKSTIDFFDNN